MRSIFLSIMLVLVLGVEGVRSETQLPEPYKAIPNLGELHFMGDRISYEYSVGGGCDDHYPQIDIQGVKLPDAHGLHFVTAKITIFDTTKTGKYDPCRAVLYEHGGLLFDRFRKQELLAKMVSKGELEQGASVENTEITFQIQNPLNSFN